MNDHSRTLPTNQGAITVKRCGCGGIHVCLGGVSINLAQETARFLKEELEKVCDPKAGALHLLPVINANTH